MALVDAEEDGRKKMAQKLRPRLKLRLRLRVVLALGRGRLTSKVMLLTGVVSREDRGRG